MYTLVFAEHRGTRKFAIDAPREYSREIMKQLEENYGGSWVLVDHLKIGEGIMFDDGLKYQGFHGRDERYINDRHVLKIKP